MHWLAQLGGANIEADTSCRRIPAYERDIIEELFTGAKVSGLILGIYRSGQTMGVSDLLQVR